MAEIIALFDADCGICQQSRIICEAMDSAKRVQFLALKEADLELLSAGLTQEMVIAELYVVFDDGSRWGGARAFFEVMRRMPGLVGLLGGLMAHRLPSAVAEPAYQWVARNRGMISYRLGLTRCGVAEQGGVTEY